MDNSLSSNLLVFPGVATFDVVVSDGQVSVPYTLVITLTNNLAPTITAPTQVTTPANVSLNFQFTATAGVVSSPMTVSASLADTNLGTVSLSGTAPNYSVSFVPYLSAAGKNSSILLSASNALVNVQTSVSLIVAPLAQATISGLSNSLQHTR